MSKAKRFVRDQFKGCKTLEEAFHRTMGPKLAMVHPNVYRVAREAFFAGAVALDSMQCEIMVGDGPSADPAITGKRLAALMDRVVDEFDHR
ncbi:MAG: hypothetical protein AAF234_20190 [Pseudomonadota bacterium]